MITVTSHQREETENLFQQSIYQNKHLGWLDLWNIQNIGGAVWLDHFQGKDYLFGLQPSGKGIYWLHSFYSSVKPDEYPLREKLKSCLNSGRNSVYTISSHKWYGDFLEQNAFRKCDEIIQLETSEIIFPKHSYNGKTTDFSFSQSELICSECEKAFPTLWRISHKEFDIAANTSNYKIVLSFRQKIAGYLFADFLDHNCHIQRIAVSPEFQNRGIGSELIRKMINDAVASGMNNFSVNTNRNNISAIRFYKKSGFKIIDDVFPVYHAYLNTLHKEKN